MKKQWVTVGLLIALDQLVKICISYYALGKRISLIPGVLRFEPFQNTNLNWFASMAGMVMPIFVMVVLQVLAAAAIILFYRYQRYSRAAISPWLNFGFASVLAGVGCSFLDVVFWGGSLDYIGLITWFIFDMKDVFLNAGWISIVIWLASKEYTSGERRSIPFKAWMRGGFKLL